MGASFDLFKVSHLINQPNMDMVCRSLEPLFFDKFLPDTWAHNDMSRQFFELFVILLLGGEAIYFVAGYLDWLFLFDKSWLNHKKILKNQVKREIWSAATSAPFISMLTVPFLLGEMRGMSKFYTDPEEFHGAAGMVLSAVVFLLWSDFLIYWIHRFLHTYPNLYKHVHKEHHVWIIPTPFAACAFHPIDGWLQSVPYLVFPYVFPIQRHL